MGATKLRILVSLSLAVAMLQIACARQEAAAPVDVPGAGPRLTAKEAYAIAKARAEEGTDGVYLQIAMCSQVRQ